MIELDEMSKIGFGAYRVSVRSVENEHALNNAIKCGCNLIDTSSNYENGDSEKLIGQVLQKQQNDKIFVITKAGYMSSPGIALQQSPKDD